MEDAKQAGGHICYYATVKDCLEALQEEVRPLDETELADTVAAAIRPRLEERVGKAQFTIGDVQSHSVKAFETGKPQFALSYTITFRVESIRQSDNNRLDAKLTATGACVFDLKSKVVSDIRPDAEEIIWTDADGREHRAMPSDLQRYVWTPVTVGSIVRHLD